MMGDPPCPRSHWEAPTPPAPLKVDEHPANQQTLESLELDHFINPTNHIVALSTLV